GRLFRHVSTQCGVPLAEIHHSGDNPVADYAAPRQLGMDATLIPVQAGGAPAGVLDVLKCPKDDPFFEMGFRVAGPTAFVMAACLAQQVTRDKPPNIIFGARDMHLVHYAFKQLSDYPASHYCRISRSAVYLAQFHATGDPVYFFGAAGDTGHIFFTRLGIPCPPELADLSPRKYRPVFLSALRKEESFARECEREFELVRDYLRHEGFQAGTWFVDLGWYGSILQAINEILALDPPVLGWYLGTVPSHPLQRGLYFDRSRPRRRFFRTIQAISFMETVFTEAVPSLARIARDGESFKFVFTADDTAEQQAARARIADGARAFIDTMIPLHKTVAFRTDRLLRALDDLYDRYLLTPPRSWIDALESTMHSGGFGGTGTRLLIDDAATLLDLLRSEWQGGYIVKHADSPWAPVWRGMHNSLFYTVYTALKKCVHGYRARRQEQASRGSC
ncbi:MAG: hypothetical protein LBU43_13030, partial [Candidatus Accumulibacter sp.]|nr:hypothetical protein [Accumulibacter sp.]